MSKTLPPSHRFRAVPHQASTEHHCRCPICGQLVDELDLEEVMQHLEPDHPPPAMN